MLVHLYIFLVYHQVLNEGQVQIRACINLLGYPNVQSPVSIILSPYSLENSDDVPFSHRGHTSRHEQVTLPPRCALVTISDLPEL